MSNQNPQIQRRRHTKAQWKKPQGRNTQRQLLNDYAREVASGATQSLEEFLSLPTMQVEELPCEEITLQPLEGETLDFEDWCQTAAPSCSYLRRQAH